MNVMLHFESGALSKCVSGAAHPGAGGARASCDSRAEIGAPIEHQFLPDVDLCTNGDPRSSTLRCWGSELHGGDCSHLAGAEVLSHLT